VPDIDEELVEWLARQLRRAHVAAYVELYPRHDSVAELFKDFPELRAGGRAYYASIARRLVRDGVGLAEPPKAPAPKRSGSLAAALTGAGLFGDCTLLGAEGEVDDD
jgi:hypothetical protein